MEIKFEEIIERAHTRKVQLEGIMITLREAPAQVEKLKEALDYFDALSGEAEALDSEARTLLGAAWRPAVKAGEIARETRTRFTGHAGSMDDARVFPNLLKALL